MRRSVGSRDSRRHAALVLKIHPKLTINIVFERCNIRVMPKDTLLVERRAGPRENQTILSCRGPFTIQTLFAFQSAVRELDSHGDVLIDLAEVPYIDSAGLGALVGAHVSSRRDNRKLVLIGAGERVKALIRMSNLEQVFPMYTSSAEAASAST